MYKVRLEARVGESQQRVSSHNYRYMWADDAREGEPLMPYEGEVTHQFELEH